VIDLAPAHKRGLALRSPVLNAAGALGYADEYAGLIDLGRLGAFVTNPLTARPRSHAHGEHAREFDGGLLVHTGLPNPGVPSAIRQFGRKWARLACPVIAHVAATTPQEVAECVERLEALENVAGVELGLRDDVSPAEAAEAVAAAVGLGSLPVLARLPLLEARRLRPAVEAAGPQALVVGAPPRGTLPLAGGGWLTGRLYGPGAFPLALRALQELAGETALPIIGAGGVCSPAGARAMLAAGAAAVQVEVAAVWRDPRIIEAIAAALES
jgi:dihydroorotate dehydrogenase (NAD+) catalytic subunit